MKTAESAKLYERACRFLSTGVSTGFRRNVTPVPLYMERGDGPYLYDVDGQEWLDYNLAWGPMILGNNHPKLNEAIRTQLQKGYTFGTEHRGEIELAELIVESVPGVERVIFSNTGTEAVQASLRLARACTGRSRFIKFEGHYHGWHNNVLVSVHPSPENLGATSPTCGGQPLSEYELAITLPWNDLAALKQAFDQYPGQIAAVLTEPILVNSGCCMPEKDYLATLIKMCRQHGTVSIFDEVITGFRVALGGARGYFGLEPDLSIYAKAIAGGFSFSAVGGRKEVFEVLEDNRTVHFGTYNGNPICVAAAIATINVLSEPGTHQRMHEHGNRVRQAIERAALANGHRLVTSGTGVGFTVHFGLEKPPRDWSDVLKADQEKAERFRSAMLAQFIHLVPEGRWFVGAVHTDCELQRVIPAIERAMEQIAKG